VSCTTTRTYIVASTYEPKACVIGSQCIKERKARAEQDTNADCEERVEQKVSRQKLTACRILRGEARY
jgi:hypothetical protein